MAVVLGSRNGAADWAWGSLQLLDLCESLYKCYEVYKPGTCKFNFIGNTCRRRWKAFRQRSDKIYGKLFENSHHMWDAVCNAAGLTNAFINLYSSSRCYFLLVNPILTFAHL